MYVLKNKAYTLLEYATVSYSKGRAVKIGQVKLREKISGKNV